MVNIITTPNFPVVKPIVKSLFLTIILNLLFIASSLASTNVSITNSWIPEAPPGARVMAGFMEIHNTTTHPIEVTKVESPAFDSVEMHLSKEVDGIAKMLQQKVLSIPAKDKLILQSGSFHLMLMKPKQKLVNGNTVKLVFTLSNGETLSLTTPVKKNKNMGTMKCGDGKCGGGKCGKGQ